MFNIFRKSIEEPKLIMTSTEELFMPVRLYYKLHNKKALIKALKKLKCVLFSQEAENHFVISYHKEAKKIDLAIPYQEVPKELYPIALADGYIVGNSELRIDTKSLRRGVGMVDFLVKSIIPSNIIEIMAMANYNKATAARNEEEYYQWFNVNYDELFNNISISDYNAELINVVKKILDPDEGSEERIENRKLEEFDKKILLLRQQEIDNYPDAEKIALHYKRMSHKEMMDMLGFRAAIKEAVARRRYKGDERFNSFDAVDNLREFVKEKILESKFH
ncbi:hypothetical protein MPCS_01696 (plasmid) [Candidatus Megaera polyxenophila]|nr:hypothetical protein MPCS_01696 [Candidatus Megaera polyxenophila]